MTVGLVIVSHSAQLAEGVAKLAGQMSQGKTPIAAAGGTLDDILGTSVERIVAAIQSVAGPDGVLVLLDLGSAILSTEMALEMLDEDQRRHVRISFAPLVEGAVTAALEASLDRTLAQVQQAAEKIASAERLQLLKPLKQMEETPTPNLEAPTEKAPDMDAGLEATLVLTNPTGLHARPASLFVQAAHRFESRIRVTGHGRESDAASITGILSLGLRQGDTIAIHASGTDAQAAITALSELVRANFYETQPTDEKPVSPAETAITAPASENIAQQPGTPWQGISTSRGVALGQAFLFTSSASSLNVVEQHAISDNQVASEQKRLRDALDAAAQELRALAARLESSIGQSHAAIFDAQALMLDDPALLESASHIIQSEHVDATTALAKAGESFAITLEALPDPLLAARATDIRDAVSRAIAQAGGKVEHGQALNTLQQPRIIIARDLTPSDTAQLRPEFVLGICTVQGGPTAHAAILARALGIPAMAGLPEDALQVIRTGDELALDADNALLYRHPAPEIRDPLAKRLAEQQAQRAALKSAAQQAQATLSVNGRHIHLMANIGSEAEAEAARQWGAQGIGLLRTEFLFAKTSTLPGEEEQRQLYATVFRAFNGDAATQRKPVIVRTLDAGADKPMPALKDILGQADEANPALGLRGIRVHLAHPHLLEQQISALLLAAADTGTLLRIMFPMITTVEEWQAARSIFDHVSDRLKNRLPDLPAPISVGIMVEVPATVVMAKELAELVDFFSIGANDLLQYTLASDRTNVSVSGLYNAMQPALLRQIHQVALAARQAGKPVAVCGEIASDARLAPVLVGLGIDELSMTPTALPEVRDAIQRVAPQKLTELIEKILQSKTVAGVETAIAELTG
ncbi:MAG TPA: phosphoenolpyruvate--protein phosphotransferase [Ktedonobacteraceae bacterium]|nr:phosphoenolpyruvate--protein phosphotransferase [Ktedonobacteraceae bacterium]